MADTASVSVPSDSGWRTITVSDRVAVAPGAASKPGHVTTSPNTVLAATTFLTRTALAIETGSEWVTTDRYYARFPGLRWRHPLSVGP